MKRIFLSITLSIIFIQLFAQTYPCETTLVGKLVTKPLLKNGKINYDLAVKDTSDPRSKNSNDFCSIKDNTKNDGNVYIARHVSPQYPKLKEDYDLLFVSEKSGKCIYQVTRIGKGGVYGIRLNENGEVIDWDENTHNTKEMQEDQEKLAKKWLTYFR